MTFSVCGRCPQTGMLGVAIATSSIAVGARCPWVKAGAGAVATQNVTLPSIGPAMLARMAAGEDSQTALNATISEDLFVAHRQVIAIDSSGCVAVFDGDKALGVSASARGENCAAAGNLLADKGAPAVMTSSFAGGAEFALPERLLRALEAGLHDGGGEVGGIHSAALLVARETSWPLVDLRVDWADAAPLSVLRRLWENYEPQMEDYVLRALNPVAAPSYGVPGDE